MAREPATRRGRQTRGRIVETADNLVAARGVQGTSLDQVLADARASKSQLYHYFEGKDDLVRAVIEKRKHDHLGAQMSLLTELDSWEGIRRWFDAAIAVQAAQGFRGGCPIGSLANELADIDDGARRDLVGCFEAWERHLVEGLERMKERGELAPGADPEELATVAFASMQGGLLLAKTRWDERPLRIALDGALAYLRSFERKP